MKPFYGLILLSLLFLLPGCSKKDAIAPPYPTDSLGRINRWISDSLRRYYYWSDEIPGKPDPTLSPELFFKSLLSSSDRFSWVSNGLDIAPPSNSYFIYGFHYAFVQVAGYDGLIGVVTDINKGGAADMRGLKRGDYFLAVEGKKLTLQNMDEVNRQLQTPYSIAITPAVYENNEWKPGDEITLLSAYNSENPVHFTRVFSAGGITTGYLYYNSFDENYDDQLLEAMSKLKQAGITELVLDLRYNAGGSVASSAKLACLIASKLNRDEIYAVYAGNRFEGRRGRSLQDVLNTSGNAAGRQYETLRGGQLSLSRVFILTTGGTISAAELIVNNLKPFLQVIQVGETTRGKNEAGFVIADYRNPRQVGWTMEPTVYKLFNKNNEGDYEHGLLPQYPVLELTQLPLADLGTSGDPFVKKALEIIYGTAVPGNYMELRVSQKPIEAKPVYRSTDDPANARPMRVNVIF